jgi:hypothetical protein
MSNTLRKRYFYTLGLTDDKEQRKRALNRAHTLRTFEIEHYWKRATYFWTFQVAIFAAFGLLWKGDGTFPKGWEPIVLALAALGILTAVANALSANGSRFWQENWEKHIDMLEDEIEGRLYKTVWLKNGQRSYSVSRVNQNLSYCFVVFWIVVFAHVLAIISGISAYPCYPRVIYFVVIAAAISGFVLLLWQRSDLPSSAPKEDGTHGEPYESGNFSSQERQRFVRRYSPDEP